MKFTENSQLSQSVIRLAALAVDLVPILFGAFDALLHLGIVLKNDEINGVGHGFNAQFVGPVIDPAKYKENE